MKLLRNVNDSSFKELGRGLAAGSLMPVMTWFWWDRPELIFVLSCTAPLGFAIIFYFRHRSRKLSQIIESATRITSQREAQEQIQKNLLEAQRLVEIGSWYFDLKTQSTFWTSELYKIFEIPEPQPQEKLFSEYMARIHPDDRAEWTRLTDRARTQGEGYVLDHRILLEHGRIKHVRGIGTVVKDESGTPVAFAGTCQDRTNDVLKDLRYQTLFETMSEAVVLQDEKGKIIQYNPSALQILGLTEDEIMGRTSFDPRWRAIREDGSDFPGEEHPAMVALRTEQPVFGKVMGLKFFHGETRWIRINALPLSQTGQIRVLATFTDITDLVRTTHDNKYIMDTFGIGVWKYNPKTGESFWDQSLRRMYEVDSSPSVDLYQVWLSSLTPEDRDRAIEEFQAALSGTQDYNTTFEIQTPSGKRKWIGSRAQVIFDDSKTPVMVYGINWDQTHEMQLERNVELERAKAIQNSKLASLGEMSAGIAHEINNPLAIISGNLTLLSSLKDQPEKFNTRITTLQKACERISRIVTGLRKFSRTSTEETRQELSLESLIQESISMIQHRANLNAVEVRMELAKDLRILCNSIEIEQVLINLLNNSMDALKDQENKWILIETRKDGADILLRVIDSGTGLTPEIEEKIFDPFFTTKPVGQGTGLGLSISRGILEQHRARIQINREFKTTCFEIRFYSQDSGFSNHPSN